MPAPAAAPAGGIVPVPDGVLAPAAAVVGVAAVEAVGVLCLLHAGATTRPTATIRNQLHFDIGKRLP
jgi:hypothetical protein